MWTYTIDENNAVFGYAPNQTEACLFQPDKPDGTPWAGKAEAEAWAIEWVNSMNNPETESESN